MSARSALVALAPRARRAAALLAGLFVLWAMGLELATSAGFIAAISSPPGVALLVLAGLAALAAAAAAPLADGEPADRVARALALAGAGLLLLSPPLSIAFRDTRTVDLGEGRELREGSLPGLPALRVGRFVLAPRGPFFPLSKTVEVPLETADGTTTVGLFPPARLGGWRLEVFQFGYAPAIEWLDAAGREVAAGFMMLGTFRRTEEEARLVEWLPQPNVMMGIGTFPPRVEDLVTPPGTDLHLHVRLLEATLGGARRLLASPDAYRWMLDGHPTDATLLLEVFEGRERRFEGPVRAGQTLDYPGGRLTVGPELLLWARIQAVRDPFVELFLAGALLLAAGGVVGLGAGVARRVRT